MLCGDAEWSCCILVDNTSKRNWLAATFARLSRSFDFSDFQFGAHEIVQFPHEDILMHFADEVVSLAHEDLEFHPPASFLLSWLNIVVELSCSEVLCAEKNVLTS